MDLQHHLVAEVKNCPSCVTIISRRCVHSCTGSLWSSASAGRTEPWKLTVPDSCPRMESLLWVSTFTHTHIYHYISIKRSVSLSLSLVLSLQYALSNEPEYRPFNPEETAVQPYQDQTYQPVYFVSESFEDAKMKMRYPLVVVISPSYQKCLFPKPVFFIVPWTFVPNPNLTRLSTLVRRRYSAAIKRPFAVRYDPFTCSVEVLDQPGKIQNALSKMREDLRTLHSALEKLCSS